jgi:hypothetical protein
VSCVIICKKITEKKVVGTLFEENSCGVAIFQPHGLLLAVDGAV